MRDIASWAMLKGWYQGKQFVNGLAKAKALLSQEREARECMKAGGKRVHGSIQEDLE
jgi:hypothetical protein